ncbi:MAG TPA: hypothetical protein VGI81_01545 [Tepidisphaeraceae bacterium]|jgi:hypothetical protein
MNAVRAIFDGKVFVPEQPVSATPQSGALVLFESPDPAAQESLDRATREYYQSGPDAEDDAWARAAAADSRRAWDED